MIVVIQAVSSVMMMKMRDNNLRAVNCAVHWKPHGSVDSAGDEYDVYGDEAVQDGTGG